jgi:hypothetical protein
MSANAIVTLSFLVYRRELILAAMQNTSAGITKWRPQIAAIAPPSRHHISCGTGRFFGHLVAPAAERIRFG